MRWRNTGAPEASEPSIRTVGMPQTRQVQSARSAFRSPESDLPNTPLAVASARAKSVSLTGFQLAALATVSAWALGVLLLLIRLAGGWLMLVRLSRVAVEVDGDSHAAFLECKAAIGLSRAVRVGVHPAIGSPVVFGCLGPHLLVPADWASWPIAKRRACLLHELATPQTAR